MKARELVMPTSEMISGVFKAIGYNWHPEIDLAKIVITIETGMPVTIETVSRPIVPLEKAVGDVALANNP